MDSSTKPRKKSNLLGGGAERMSFFRHFYSEPATYDQYSIPGSSIPGGSMSATTYSSHTTNPNTLVRKKKRHNDAKIIFAAQDQPQYPKSTCISVPFAQMEVENNDEIHWRFVVELEMSDGTTITTRHRYSEFFELHKQWTSKHPTLQRTGIEFPKRMVTVTDSDIARRTAELEVYMRKICTINAVLASVAKFLKCEESALKAALAEAAEEEIGSSSQSAEYDVIGGSYGYDYPGTTMMSQQSQMMPMVGAQSQGVFMPSTMPGPNMQSQGAPMPPMHPGPPPMMYNPNPYNPGFPPHPGYPMGSEPGYTMGTMGSEPGYTMGTMGSEPGYTMGTMGSEMYPMIGGSEPYFGDPYQQQQQTMFTQPFEEPPRKTWFSPFGSLWSSHHYDQPINQEPFHPAPKYKMSLLPFHMPRMSFMPRRAPPSLPPRPKKKRNKFARRPTMMPTETDDTAGVETSTNAATKKQPETANKKQPAPQRGEAPEQKRKPNVAGGPARLNKKEPPPMRPSAVGVDVKNRIKMFSGK